MEIKKVDRTDDQSPDAKPICPHCKTEYDKINMTKIEGTFGKRFVYFCINCRATLGVSHRKGFWMG
jgi:hypothetical protein